ncbi:hypothetical protein [Streptomyces sp. NPDC056291]|uniref:hypothetical protein n=1 Tax=Streptomyces sp. NPDC056291 TaxID=3345772 RepID=UPI0035DA9554
MLGELEGDVCGGVPHHQRQRESGGDEHDVDQFGDRAQAVGSGEVAGQQRGDADRGVSGGRVQPGRQPPALRPDQVDLHVHRHRSGQALIQAQQNVRGDDQAPGRRPGEDEWDEDAEDPAGHEDLLATEAGGQGAGGEVGERLGDTEGDDEGEDRQVAGQMEGLGADQRNGGAFQTDQTAASPAA